MAIHAISNVRILNGRKVDTAVNVTFRASPGDIISIEPGARNLASIDTAIDGRGCTLLPAFIDSNVDTAATNMDLPIFASYGIGTVLDMSSSKADIQAMRAESMAEIGLPAYLASGPIATAQATDGAQIHPRRETGVVEVPAGAEMWVASLLNGPTKSDYIKVLVDLPGIDSLTLIALVQAAHRHGKLAVAHSFQKAGYSRALQAGFDVITLVPIDGLIETEVAENLATRNVACIPTLCMARAMIPLLLRETSNGMEDISFDYAVANVKRLYDAGVRICAGTEANQISHAPILIGESLHEEMELLVRAGLSNLDALRAATIVPATVFGMGDRGEISLGRRADMVLVEGNPLQDITTTRKIRKVWIGGVEMDGWDAVSV
ncbi:putative hydrolase [Fusarium flagelliforme]|uniref:Amidohydrolase 1 n=1 Tax=Fusarium flagelliforme TaxID=2675880 RepID=A0A395M6H8_9HYPO|nr:putative hydrolase [Fusarium flagelliforme]KAH7169711.1 putative hydrolase [Fusarium flagelliforme]RFN43454.1 amidohydrolase 1 [Fusarium flagelliforme]